MSAILEKIKTHKTTPYLLALLASFLVTLVFFSNTFTRSNGEEVVLPLQAFVSDYDIEINGSGVYVGTGGGTITLDGLDFATGTLTIVTTSNADYPFPVSGDTYIKDDSNIMTYSLASTFLLSPAGKENEVTVAFDSKGNASSVLIEFHKAKTPYYITSIIVNKPVSFRFGWAQFAALSVCGIVVCFVIQNKLYRIVLNFDNKAHKMTVLASVLLCMFFANWVMNVMGTDFSSIDKEITVNHYYDQFLAFQEGQVELLIEPDEILTTLSNPYDRSLRKAVGAPSIRDLAYYNDVYYFYFGIAPIIAVYYPVYWLTGHIPGGTFVCFMLCILGIAAMAGALWEFTRKFVKEPNLLLYLLVSIAMPFSCYLYVSVATPAMYNIAMISAISFLALFYYLAYRAARTQHAIARRVLFVLAGIAFVFVAGSRTNYVLAGMAGVAPLFIEVLLDKERKLVQRLLDAIVFVTPVAFGALGLMYYNYIRFDSAFDFGFVYQLTVSDIRYNKLVFSPKYFAEMIYAYFLLPLKRSFTFPFVSFQHTNIGVHGNYLFEFLDAGILNFPIYWFLFCMPKATSKKEPVKTATMWLLLVSAIVMGYANFCLGGVIYRYVCDLMLPLILVAAVTMLTIFSGKRSRGGGWLYTFACLMCFASIAIGVLGVFSNEPNYIYHLNPDVYIRIAQFFAIG